MPASYIVQRGRQYHLRLRVPADLAHLFGRRELHRSLRVADPRHARSLANTFRASIRARGAGIGKPKKWVAPRDLFIRRDHRLATFPRRVQVIGFGLGLSSLLLFPSRRKPWL